MTSEQATQAQTALSTAGSTVMGDFITLLPAVAGVIGVIFAIKFISYWLKRFKNAH